MISTSASAIENSGSQYIREDWERPRSPNQEIFPLTAGIDSRDCLEIGGCSVTELVKQFGSPLYILDEQTVRTACRQYRQAFSRYYPGPAGVIYASKAWNCLAVCAIAASEGLGIDVATGGELHTAIQAGVTPETLYFHGNNKSRAELELAVETGCTVMVDNWLELHTLIEVGSHSPKPIPIMLRITPGIECHTHEYIRTGHLDSKFGFDPNQLEEVFAFVGQQKSLSCIGLHAHIGSQIFEVQPHEDLADVMVQWAIAAAKFGLPVTELNVGGGLGIRYLETDDPPSIDEWVKVVSRAIAAACKQHQFPLPKLLCEPGRSIVGPAACTAYTIGSRKQIPGMRTYLAVDGGMSDNARPITYQAVYRAAIANRMSAAATETVTIAGKHCESGDLLIRDLQLPPTEPGDILVIACTGAYNYSMASNYNRLPRPAAVLVNAGNAETIVERETYQDLMRCDRLPERLT